MSVPFRYRLGQRLLRPYLVRSFWHYSKTADSLEEDDPKRAERCRYIAIGFAHANGEPWTNEGFDD